MPTDFKPMHTVGSGVFEIRVRGTRGDGEKTIDDMQMTEGSGNVFRDLGFGTDEAENLQIRSQLMMSLADYIEEGGLTQEDAAELLGVTQPRISDLVRGKIDRFSIDMLVNMHAKAGMRVQLTVVKA